VHCWGGLGSQLFAYSISELLYQKYPKKDIRLVLHTSGVTKRSPAIKFVGQKFQIISKDDFNEHSSVDVQKIKPRQIMKHNIKFILKKTYFLLEGNTTSELKKIKPWTLILRGHYSYAEIPDLILKKMKQNFEELLQLNFKGEYEKNIYIGVHYRLGDLVTITNKSPIGPNSITEFISKVAIDQQIKETHIYSDDLVLAKKLLETQLTDSVFYKDLDIWAMMANLMHCRYFIGTNSKISIWITLFRLVNNPNSLNALPESMKQNLLQVWPKVALLKNVFFY